MGFLNKISHFPQKHKKYWPDIQTDASKRKSTSNYYRKHVLIFNFSLYKPFISFLQKSAIFISNCRFSLKTVNCDSLQWSRNAKLLVSFWRADTAVIFWIIKDSHSQKCDPTRRNSCRTHSFVSKKHFVYFSEHLFCSIRQLTCVYHVKRINSTL